VEAADANRGIGARDQEGSRKAATGHRDPDRSRLAGPCQAWRGLSELVDAALKEFLIVVETSLSSAEISLSSAKIRQLVGVGRRKTRRIAQSLK